MPIPAQRFDAKSIADLDNGLYGIQINDEIAKIVRDIDERGHDGQPRTLTLTLTFQRDMSRGAEPTIAIDPRVKTKLPDYRAGLTNSKLAAGKDGEFGLLFQKHNADNAEQPSLLDDDEGK